MTTPLDCIIIVSTGAEAARLQKYMPESVLVSSLFDARTGYRTRSVLVLCRRDEFAQGSEEIAAAWDRAHDELLLKLVPGGERIGGF